MIGALLLAAGSGTRMKGEIRDKLLHPIGDNHAFGLSVRSFFQVPEIQRYVITYNNTNQLALLQKSWNEEMACSAPTKAPLVDWVTGGKDRKDSVKSGLLAFPIEVTHVLIHDCARPFIRPYTISLLADEVRKDRAVSVARPLTDTLRSRNEWIENPLAPATTRTLDRSNLWKMETPQGAPREWLIDGLIRAEEIGRIVTDDMEAIELIGYKIGFLSPDYPNPKITTPDDFAYAKFLLQS